MASTRTTFGLLRRFCSKPPLIPTTSVNRVILLRQSDNFIRVRPFSCSSSLTSYKQQQQQVEDEVDVGPVDPLDPSGQKAIYEGILSTQIKLVKGFSLMTSVLGITAQPILYMHIQNAAQVQLPAAMAFGAVFSFFTFVTPLLVHSVAKKYVTKMYYDSRKDTYTAVTYSFLIRPKEVKFKADEVQVPDIPGMFTTFKAKNKALFVDGDAFDNPQHYGKIMGYDKPLNLRWKNYKE